MTITEAVTVFTSDSFDEHRYSSFDYCYNHFRANHGGNLLADKEKSSAILGFYLASWGMMRGSSFLLQKSYKYFIPLIEYVADSNAVNWEIQPSQYIEKFELIKKLYDDIGLLVLEDNNRGIVLITKIMLGVFGIVPAFDENFCKCFRMIDPNRSRFASFSKNSMAVIQNFYEENQAEIDTLSNLICTKDFSSSRSRFNYPKAKIIDMYGFEEGASMK